MKLYDEPRLTARVRSHLTFFSIVALGALASSLSYFYVYNLSLEAGAVFNWIIPPYPEDGLGYTAWVKQAMEGAFLFKIKYTSIEHSPVIFQPFFLLVGWTAALLGWSSGFSLFIFRILGIFVFGYSLSRFFDYFQILGRVRAGALILILFSSGLGGLFGLNPADSVDLHDVGANLFWSMSWNPLFPWMYACILEIIVAFERRYYFVSGALMALLAFCHPYDIVFTGAILGLLFFWKRDERDLKDVWRFAIFAGPAVAGQFALSKLHPVLAAHENAQMSSPAFSKYLYGFGLPFFASFFGAFLVCTRKELDRFLPLVFWIGSAFLLLYVPMWFQKKMIFGVMIPMCVLAAIALDQWFKKSNELFCACIAAILAVSAFSHRVNFEQLKVGVQQDQLAYFYPRDFLATAEYLDKSSVNDDVVFTSVELSRNIPGLTGNTVLYGHWAQSIDFAEKRRWVDRIFSCANTEGEIAYCKTSLKESRVRYILLDPVLRFSRGENLPSWLESETKLVLKNEHSSLYEVDIKK
jgi:hypothetical protein